MGSPFPQLRGLATVQVDIDSFDTIRRGYGLAPDGHSGPDPVIAHAVPRYLALFDAFGVKATFFVVGKDFELEANLPFFRAILEAGHEIANHSYYHVGFDLLSPSGQAEDIMRCHDAVRTNLGYDCRGFKAPCYAITPGTLASLMEQSYLYDSSMIATILSPIIKTYYRLLLRKSIHPSNWGRLSHILSPRTPYRPNPDQIWKQGGAHILEIPVTTFPFLKIPFHFSFINVMGSCLISSYFSLAKHIRDNFLNFAFHAIDLIPIQELPEVLRSRPGMHRPDEWRQARAENVLAEMKARYSIHPSASIAESVLSG